MKRRISKIVPRDVSAHGVLAETILQEDWVAWREMRHGAVVGDAERNVEGDVEPGP